MTQKLFTKSAFRQALFCPTSLYYYYDREHYANQNNEDDFLQALAEGGLQVGDLAKVYYRITEGCDIKELAYDQALRRTEELLKEENVNIAEAAFRFGNCFVRADIIEKKGTQINLIEVKAKSWDPGSDSFFGKRNKNSIQKGILEYVYDVAFQKYVIQQALGEGITVKAFLMMVNKQTKAPINGMNSMFKVVNQNGKPRIDRDDKAEELAAKDWILTPFDIDALCDLVIAGNTEEQDSILQGKKFKDFVTEMSQLYVAHSRIDSPLSDTCFKCPFYSNENSPGLLDGKKECWIKQARLADKDFERPTVGELWGGGAGAVSIKRKLMEHDLLFLDQVEPEHLPPSRPSVNPGLLPSDRRLLQIALTTKNERMLQPFRKNIRNGVYVDIQGLKEEMRNWHHPLHMIDFETSSAPIPFYKGRHPYEAVAFQFSHHIIDANGNIRHAGQYLNKEKLHFPNFEFVRELKKQLEVDNGTIFRYATHENTILLKIRQQLEVSSEPDKEELILFIDSITHASRSKSGGERDMVDLLKIVQRYYYHPDMKGSNSIKVVLPAILNSSQKLRQKYEQPIYGKTITSLNYSPEDAFSWITYTPDGKVDNPYNHLQEIASFLGVSTEKLGEYDRFDADDSFDNEQGSRIANGGAALAAYTKLQFSDDLWMDALAEALLRYCELDTMSMVFIWEYLHEVTSMSK